MTHPNFIAALEVHHEPLIEKFSDMLSSIEILKEKEIVCNKYYIPNKYHLWKHSILNWQINDSGFFLNSISLRSIYDALILQPKGLSKILKNSTKEIKHFFTLISVFDSNYSSYNPIRKIIFISKLKFKPFEVLSYNLAKSKKLFFLSFEHIIIFITSKTYRSIIFENPKLIIKKFKNKISEF